MKVKIGSYPSRLTCNIHTRYMDKKYGFVNWPKEQTKFEDFLEKVEDIIQTCYQPINYFLDKRTQKISVKIDKWDTWGMDHTLAHIVLPMLKQLKETKHGAPYVDLDDIPDSLLPTDEPLGDNGYVDNTHFERWDWVMDEMIWAFEQKTIDWEDRYYGEVVEDPTKPLGLSLPNYDAEGLKAHQERMTNGFRLFGKYYESLWD